MSEKDRKVILGYDVGALKRNIETHKRNMQVFAEAVDDARRDIVKLEYYIKMIEEAERDGDHLRPHK